MPKYPGVKFYRDPNGCIFDGGNYGDGYNGLAVFLNHPLRERDSAGVMKDGWIAFVAQVDGPGDGPYVADRTSKNYVEKHCKAVTEDEAAKMFPKLAKLVEEGRDVWEEKGD